MFFFYRDIEKKVSKKVNKIYNNVRTMYIQYKHSNFQRLCEMEIIIKTNLIIWLSFCANRLARSFSFPSSLFNSELINSSKAFFRFSLSSITKSQLISSINSLWQQSCRKRNIITRTCI